MESDQIIMIGLMVVIAIAIGVGGITSAVDKARYTDYTTTSLGEEHSVTAGTLFNLNNKNVRLDLGSLIIYNATTPYVQLPISNWTLIDSGESQVNTTFSGDILVNYTAVTRNTSGISSGALVMASLAVLVFIAVILIFMIRKLKH